uniref:Ig-like domain-containing protein n=1 Tax=Cynoglossus semilaevis TaxID=244447 RepID=A0A3P8W9N7_CYNSE
PDERRQVPDEEERPPGGDEDRGPGQKLKNQEAVEEGSVMLRCELSKPGVPVEWRRDAQLLKEGDKYQMKQEGNIVLHIRELTLADSGIYTCEAVNKFGASSYNGNVTVVHPKANSFTWSISSPARKQSSTFKRKGRRHSGSSTSHETSKGHR